MACVFSASLMQAQELIKPMKIQDDMYQGHALKSMYYDSVSDSYLTKQKFIKKYGREAFNELIETAGVNTDFKYRLDPVSLVTGGSMIGVSLAVYALTNSIVSDEMSVATDPNKIKSIGETQRIVGYVCAGVSIAGVVVLLSGLHKEYKQGKGFIVDDNLYFDSTDIGVAFRYTF